MSSEYTLTDDEVRAAWVRYQTREHDWSETGTGGMFDRWLAKVKAEELREAASWMRRSKDSGHWNLRDPQDPGTSYSPDRWLDVRANRIEQEVTNDGD